MSVLRDVSCVKHVSQVSGTLYSANILPIYSYPGSVLNIEKSYLFKSSCMNLLDPRAGKFDAASATQKMQNMPTPAYAPKQNAYIQPFAGQPLGQLIYNFTYIKKQLKWLFLT